MKNFTFFAFVLSLLSGLNIADAYGQAGVMDCDFGNNGVVTTPFTTGTDNTAYDLVAYEGQAGGAYENKIVVAGTDKNSSGDYDFAVARYNADGTLDTSFGNGGKVTIDFGFDGERARGVALQNDGKIVLVGSSGNPSFCAIARLNADGSLDTSFDADGRNRTAEGYWNDLAIDSNGNIFVSGSYSSTSNVLKFSSSGGLLNNFSYDLTAGTACCEGFNAIAVDSNDRIVVAGGSQQTTRDMSVIRINSNGSLDTSFDGDGKKFIDFNNDWDVAGSIAINASGKIAIAGEAPNGDFGIALLNSDGSFDTTFGGGKVSVDLDGGTSDQSNSGVFFQDDGKIIGGCYASGQYGMVRYNANGTLDTSFSDDGKGLFRTDAMSGDYPNSFFLAPNGDFLACGIAWVESGDAGKDFGIISVRTQSENMVYGASTAVQNTGIISPGSKGAVIGLQVEVCGDLNPHSVTQIDFSTTGTTDLGDIADAEIYYTGTSNLFETSNQFGSTVVSPNGTHSISGSQSLLHGTNYFWISYSVKSDATQGNFVDARCSQLTIDGGIGVVVPDETNPAGNREIKSVVFEQNFGVDESSLPSGWTIQDVDNDGSNWTTLNDPNGGGVNGRSGGGMRSASWEDTEKEPVDNRLITPEIDLNGYSSASLSFYLASVDIYGGFENENVEVYISTNWDGTSDFPMTEPLGTMNINSSNWTEFNLDMDAYTGNTVHICWVHKMDDTSLSWGLRMDDVLATGVPEVQAGILIKQETTEIASGGAYSFGGIDAGSSADAIFTIENAGSGGLSLTGNPIVAISGADAGDFNVQVDPAPSVASGGTTSFTLRFSPTTGEKSATVSIENNSSGSPYTFQVSGTGSAMPVVTTQSVDEITYSSSSGNGTISSVGFPYPTQHGHVWNTSGAPEVSDAKTELGAVSSTGSFVSSLSGLTPGTMYYVRSYAVSDLGVAYGSVVSFETPRKELTLSGSFSINDKVYDGNKDAVVAAGNLSLSGLETGDDVALENISFQFASSAPGSDIVVNILSADLTGTDASKYILSLTGAPVSSASILAKELSINGSFSVADKDYDGNTSAGITSNGLMLSGVLGADDVALVNTEAVFTSSNPGSDITVVLNGGELSGADAGNYVLSFDGAPTSLAEIFPPVYTVTIYVTDGGGAPVSGADVEIASNNLVTGELGTTSLDLEDGIYSLVVSQSGNVRYDEEVAVSGADIQVDVVLASTSVSEPGHLKVLLYPVPFVDELNIQGADNLQKIIVLDVSGQIVRDVQNPSGKIKTSDINSGIYFVKLIHKDGKVELRKIIKE